MVKRWLGPRWKPFEPSIEEEKEGLKSDPFRYGKHKYPNLSDDELKELKKNRTRDYQKYGIGGPLGVNVSISAADVDTKKFKLLVPKATRKGTIYVEKKPIINNEDNVHGRRVVADPPNYMKILRRKKRVLKIEEAFEFEGSPEEVRIKMLELKLPRSSADYQKTWIKMIRWQDRPEYRRLKKLMLGYRKSLKVFGDDNVGWKAFLVCQNPLNRANVLLIIYDIEVD